MRCNSKSLLIISLAYIYIPIVIFLIGNTSAWVWLSSVAVCVFFVYRMYKEYAADRGDDIRLSWPVFVVAFVFISLVCIVLGYGGLFNQAGDYYKHNAILRDLLLRDWPVYYTEYEDSMLTYYVGQYLVPAAFGKCVKVICHIDDEVAFSCAEAMMAIWNIFGIILGYLNLVRITVSGSIRKQLRLLYILIFFSGALPLTQIICNGVLSGKMYSLDSYHWILTNRLMIQYRSNLVMLRWVFPQVIAVWLIIVLWLDNKERINHYVLLLLPILLFGTFSVVVMAPLALIYAVYEILVSKQKLHVVKDVFSLSNILSFLTLGTVFISYFVGYLQVKKPEYMAFGLVDIDWQVVLTIVVFDFFMFGIYSICIYSDNKKNIIFYLINVMLIFIPFFKMGLFNDWVMSTSIPALFILMIYVIRTLNATDKVLDSEDSLMIRKRSIRATIIIIMIIIGSWYPFMEIRDNVRDTNLGDNTLDDYYTLEHFSNRKSDEGADLIYNYYTYDLEGKCFYEYLAKKRLSGVANSIFATHRAKNRCDGLYFDTYVSIVAYDDTSSKVLNNALLMCADYEKIFSTTDEESELYRINNRAEYYDVSDSHAEIVISHDLAEVINAGLRYGEITDERFNICLGTVNRLWDFHNNESIIPNELDINEALKHISLDDVYLKTGEKDILCINDDELEIDLGGIAKGYIANKLRDYLISEGCSEAVISLGGNVLCIGSKDGAGYTVGVQKPFGYKGETIDTIKVIDTSVVSSGVYERYIESEGIRFHHIINPVTGYSANTDIDGVTIECADSMKADVVSTTVLMLGKEGAIQFLDSINEIMGGEPVTRAVIVDDQGKVLYWNDKSDNH